MFSVSDLLHNPTQMYLAVVFAVTLFRVSVYMITIEHPSKVKISPEAWTDPRVREVTYAWVKTILMFMQYRLLVVGIFFLFSRLPESIPSREKFLFCLANVLIDMRLFYGMVMKFGKCDPSKGKDDCAIAHRNNIPPLFLQSLLLLSGIAYAAFMYMNHPHYYSWDL